MKYRVILVGIVVIFSVVVAAQVAVAHEHPHAYLYKGCYGSVAIDLNSGQGAALYRYPQYNAIYNTTAVKVLEGHHNYYFVEKQYPLWYWIVAKYPTYCGCCCKGYRVRLAKRPDPLALHGITCGSHSIGLYQNLGEICDAEDADGLVSPPGCPQVPASVTRVPPGNARSSRRRSGRRPADHAGAFGLCRGRT